MLPSHGRVYEFEPRRIPPLFTANSVRMEILRRRTEGVAQQPRINPVRGVHSCRFYPKASPIAPPAASSIEGRQWL
jgi:hypothetical protein